MEPILAGMAGGLVGGALIMLVYLLAARPVATVVQDVQPAASSASQAKRVESPVQEVYREREQARADDMRRMDQFRRAMHKNAEYVGWTLRDDREEGTGRLILEDNRDPANKEFTTMDDAEFRDTFNP